MSNQPEGEEHGWQPIGSLLPKTGISPPASASTPTGSPDRSATTGPPPPARRASNGIGPRRGATGAAAKPGTWEAVAATDDHLEASLKQQLGQWLVLAGVRTLTFPNGEYAATVRIPKLRKGAPIDLVDECSRMVRGACQPMARREILAGLSRLRTLTAARKEDTDDMQWTLETYADELEEYPGDVVAYVLRTQHKVDRWWPAWAELAERLDRESARRFTLRDALRRR